MRKTFLMIAGLAATVMGAPAYANVTCTPGNCKNADNSIAKSASFSVTPDGVGPSYRGPISASIANTVTKKGNFTDTFTFQLPTNGIGGGSITTIAATFKGATDLDFTSVLVNGVNATVSKIFGGVVEIAFASGVALSAGSNSIVVNGLSRGNGSYGGSISFAPAVPEMATWGMMILGFVGTGAAMRRRRNTTVTFGHKRAFA